MPLGFAGPLGFAAASEHIMAWPPWPPVLQIGEQIKKMPGSDGINPYAQLVEDAEGLDKIENLQVQHHAIAVLLSAHCPYIGVVRPRYPSLGCHLMAPYRGTSRNTAPTPAPGRPPHALAGSLPPHVVLPRPLTSGPPQRGAV